MGNGKQYLLSFTAFFHTGKRYALAFNLHQRIANKNQFPYMFDPWSRFQAVKMEDQRQGVKVRSAMSMLYPLLKQGAVVDMEGELKEKALVSGVTQYVAYTPNGEAVATEHHIDTDPESYADSTIKYTNSMDEEILPVIISEREQDVQNVRLSTSVYSSFDSHTYSFSAADKKEITLLSELGKYKHLEKAASEAKHHIAEKADTWSFTDGENQDVEKSKVVEHELSNVLADPFALKDLNGAIEQAEPAYKDEKTEYTELHKMTQVKLDEEANIEIAEEKLSSASRLLQILYGDRMAEQVQGKVRDLLAAVDYGELMSSSTEFEAKLEELMITERDQANNEGVLTSRNEWLGASLSHDRYELEEYALMEGDSSYHKVGVVTDESIMLATKASGEAEVFSDLKTKNNGGPALTIEVNENLLQANSAMQENVIVHTDHLAEESLEFLVDQVDHQQGMPWSNIEADQSDLDESTGYVDNLLRTEILDLEAVQHRVLADVSEMNQGFNVFTQEANADEIESVFSYDSFEGSSTGQEYGVVNKEIIDDVDLFKDWNEAQIARNSDLTLEKIVEFEKHQVMAGVEEQIEQSLDVEEQDIEALLPYTEQAGTLYIEYVEQSLMETGQEREDYESTVYELPIATAQVSTITNHNVGELSLERAQVSDHVSVCADELLLDVAHFDGSPLEAVNNNLSLERAHIDHSASEGTIEGPLEVAQTSDEAKDSENQIIEGAGLNRMNQEAYLAHLDLAGHEGNSHEAEIEHGVGLESQSHFIQSEEVSGETATKESMTVAGTELSAEAFNVSTFTNELDINHLESGSIEEMMKDGIVENEMVQTYFSDLVYQVEENVGEIGELSNGTFEGVVQNSNQAALRLLNLPLAEMAEDEEASRSRKRRQLSMANESTSSKTFRNKIAKLLEEHTSTSLSKNRAVSLVDDYTGSPKRANTPVLLEEDNPFSKAINKKPIILSEHDLAEKKMKKRDINLAVEDEGIWKKERMITPPFEDEQGIGKLPDPEKPPVDPVEKKKIWLIMGKPYPAWSGWDPKKTR